MTLALRQRPLSRVVMGIVKGGNGALFDPSDLSTLYQDAAGTIPVTAVEQPVGLMLDKARGMMLGPELVSNGSFDTDAGSWAPLASGVTNYTIDSGTVIVTTNAASGLTQMVPTEVGKFYRATVKLKSISGVSGSCRVDAPFGTIVAQTALSSSLESTTVQVIFKATSSKTTIYLRVSSAGTFSFDEVSTRELYGYHATQPITASRPTLSARYNLLTKTEDFESAAWSKNNYGTGVIPIVTNNYGVAPDGSNTATRVQLNKGGGTTSSDYSSIFQTAAVIPGTNYSGGFWLKTNDETIKTLQLRDDVATIVNKLINASPEWVFIPYAGSATASSSNTMRIWLRGERGTSDSADILVWHPQLSIVTTPGPYQRVNTATDYDTDERYFKKYLRFDGVDDYLNLPYMGLYANGSASVVAGLKSEDAAGIYSRILAETNSTLASPRYILLREDLNTPSININIVDDGGTSILDTGLVTLTNGESSIVSVVDSGSKLSAYKNAAEILNTSYARAGLVTLDSLTIGAQRAQSGAYNAFTKSTLYGLIITKSALTDSQRIRCERYLGRKSGVQL